MSALLRLGQWLVANFGPPEPVPEPAAAVTSAYLWRWAERGCNIAGPWQHVANPTMHAFFRPHRTGGGSEHALCRYERKPFGFTCAAAGRHHEVASEDEARAWCEAVLRESKIRYVGDDEWHSGTSGE